MTTVPVPVDKTAEDIVDVWGQDSVPLAEIHNTPDCRGESREQRMHRRTA